MYKISRKKSQLKHIPVPNVLKRKIILWWFKILNLDPIPMETKSREQALIDFSTRTRIQRKTRNGTLR